MQYIGRYQVRGELGRGGMAIVYRALDPRFDREVAIKLLPKHFTHDPKFLERFQKEAKIIAALEHPAIVPVYDFGDHEDQPYLVMRYMAGGSLSERLRNGRLPLVEVSRILDRLAPGLDKAHKKGVIHRDIKPGNVFFDEDNLPYLGDFGIARMAEGTQTMTMIATPAYMSPEQAEGVKKIDWRADIYAVGVMLFELLGGKQPYKAETATGQMLMHVLQPIPNIQAINPELPPEAQRIINQAMAKERSLRYSTVAELAEDVRHLLLNDTANSAVNLGGFAFASSANPTMMDTAPQGPSENPQVDDGALQESFPSIATQPEPVSNHAKDKGSLKWLWLVVGLIVIGTVAGLVFLVSGVFREGDKESVAGEGGLVADEALFEVTIERIPVVVPVDTPTMTPAASSTPISTASATSIPDADGDGILDADDACPETAGSEAAGGCPATPTATSIFPKFDGTPLPPGELAMITTENAGDMHLLSRLGKGRIMDADLHPGGNVISGSSPTGIYLYDSQSLEELKFIDTDGFARIMDYSPDGQMVAASSGSEVNIWRIEDEELLQNFTGHNGWVRTLAFAPDGKTLAVGSHGSNSIRLWDVEGGSIRQVLEGHEGRVTALAYALDGQTLASGSADRTARLWDPISGRELNTFEGHTGWVRSVSFSPDGSLLATGSHDDTIKLWEVSTGNLIDTLEGHEDQVWRVLFSADGLTLASASADDTINLWRVGDGTLLQTLLGHEASVINVLFAPDSSKLYSSAIDNTIRMWNVADGQLLGTVEGHLGPVNSVSLSPDGSVLAAGYDDNKLRLWQVSDGRLIRVIEGHEGAVLDVAFGPNGRQLASGSADETVRLWDPASGTLLQTISGHSEPVNSIAFSPDGGQLASGSDDRTIRLWDARSGEQLRILQGSRDAIKDVAWTPDGQIVTGAAGDKLHLWQTDNGQLRQTLEGHFDEVTSVDISADGRTLASGAGDETVRLWDVASGEVLQTLGGHNGRVHSVAFSPDGSILATSSSDDIIRLWNVANGHFLGELIDHTDQVWSLDFAADGLLLASGSEDGTVRLWGVSPQ